MAFLVFVQITLGALVVLSGLQPIINTAHVVNGSLVLASSFVLTLRSFRTAFERSTYTENAVGRVTHGATIVGARP
jgi:heme A synthase